MISREKIYRAYIRSSSAKYWFKRRFRPAGVLVVLIALASAAVGVDTNLNMAYQAFCLAAALLLLAMGWALWPLPRISARRTLPRFATAGQPVDYKVALRNPTAKTITNLSLLEDFGDPRPTLEQFLNTPEPEERRRNAFDRHFGYFRWQWLIAQNNIARPKDQPVGTIPPGQTVELSMQLCPLKRGRLDFNGLTAAFNDPLGLFRGFVSLPAPDKLLVLPKRYRVPLAALPGVMEYQPGGVSLASTVGESEEFISLREYRQGDPLRRIHWKSSCRTGKLIVKEYQDEFFIRHALILDTFLTRNDSELFEEAVSVAASFACVLQTQESLLDLMFVGPKAYRFTAGRGLGQVDQMLEILACVHPCAAQTFEELAALVAGNIHVVSGAVCIFLDWDEARRQLVSAILANRVPLVVYVLVPKGALKNLDPGPIAADPASFRILEVGKIQEDLGV